MLQCSGRDWDPEAGFRPEESPLSDPPAQHPGLRAAQAPMSPSPLPAPAPDGTPVPREHPKREAEPALSAASSRPGPPAPGLLGPESAPQMETEEGTCLPSPSPDAVCSPQPLQRLTWKPELESDPWGFLCSVLVVEGTRPSPS